MTPRWDGRVPAFMLFPSVCFILAFCVTAAGGMDAGGDPSEIVGSQPLLAEDGSRSFKGGRAMVILNESVSEAILTQLSEYGTVHGWVGRYRMVAMTPHGRDVGGIRDLSYVRTLEKDRERHLDDVGTWDRDMIDVTDVEESGIVGDPDAREVDETGAGVHVAVIDSGLIQNWRDVVPEERVAVELARAIMGGGAVAEDFVPANDFKTSNPTNLWERDTSSHGTAVASHVIGFRVGSLLVDGVAPGARLIPLKVFPNGESATWSSQIIAAIGYVQDLVENGMIGPAVINMSLGSSLPNTLEETAINSAIASGIVLVASAGNRGENGVGFPGGYRQMISVGAVGWTEQLRPGTAAAPNTAFWWSQDVLFDPDRGRGPFEESQAYVATFSGRAIPSRGQQLDVLAPGRLNVAPGLHGPQTGLFFWSGTSFSSPLTAGVAALLLERRPELGQVEVESLFKSTALPMPSTDSREVLEFSGETTISWDEDCNGVACDPVGAGLLQADDALAAVPKGKRVGQQ